MSNYWSCPKCGHVNDGNRTRTVCEECGKIKDVPAIYENL